MAVSRRRRERKLPVQQLSILAICRFAEPLATTSLLPYLPGLVESFQVPQNEIAKWAGYLSACFSISQAVMGIPWGLFSDIYGRKLSILLGLFMTMCTSILLGLSMNLPMAFAARALAGAGNGNVGILRTTVAEMVPFKELQPKAFSIMPLVWTVGSIFGPMLGGLLANPFNVKPGEKRPHANVFEQFPYLLPNLVSAILFAIGITIGTLFLEETLETLRARADIGLILGRKLLNALRRASRMFSSLIRRTNDGSAPGERDPLLKSSTMDEENTAPFSKPSHDANQAVPTLRQVMNKQSAIIIITYTILALHSLAYDQLLSVYAQRGPIGSHGSTPYSAPLRFAGGIGLNSFSFGIMLAVYAVVGMAIQFLIFPPLCRKFGVLFWFKVVSCLFPIVYFVTPFTALLPTDNLRIGSLLVVMLFKSWCVIFAFPCNIILLTNSANSLRVLGTLNGFATTMSAIGRAAGPAISGSLFTLGMNRGYLIAPFWFLSAMGLLGVVAVFFVVDGEGFGADAEEDEREVQGDNAWLEREDEDLQSAAADGQGQAADRPGPMLAPTGNVNTEDDNEQNQGGSSPSPYLPRTSSAAVDSDDESEGGLLSHSSRRVTSTSQIEESSSSRVQESFGQVKRRTSVPIGMGSKGISHRYSTNLGQGLGGPGNHQEA